MMYTLVFFLLALILLIGCHEGGHFIAARLLGVHVLRFSLGFGKALIKWQDKRGTEYTWALIPLGGYVKMLDETTDPVPSHQMHQAFNRQSVYRRFLIVLAGPVANFFLAWILIALTLWMGVPMTPTSTIIEKVETGTPAFHAGLKPNDEILRLNQSRLKQGREVARWVQTHPDENILIQFKRNGKIQTRSVHVSHMTYQGKVQGWLGVQLKMNEVKGVKPELYRETFTSAVTRAGVKTGQLISSSFSFLGQLITGHLSMQQVSGPVGIAQFAGASAQQGVVPYLLFLALVSISLGVLNLLPIPMLDGGHLFYYVIEIILRKPVPIHIQEKATYLGFIILMIVTVVAFKNDLARLGF